MSNPLGVYVAPFKPLNNITPFTYRDGLSYLEVLEDMRDYVNNTLVAYVNDNFNELGDEFETQVNVLLTQVNAAIEAVIASSVEVQDEVVEGIFQDEESATFIYTMSIFATKAIETIVTSGRLSDANLIAEFAAKSIETIVTSGRLSDASLIAEFAVKSIETIVTSGRLSVASLDTTYALKSIETIVTSGRLSDASLIAEFAVKSIETIVTSGRLSVASLDAAYIDPTELAKYSINQFSTAAALIASTPAGGNQVYASALDCKGSLFRYDSGAWKMYGEAYFADITARDAALTNTVLTAIGANARCYLTTPKMRMENAVAAPSITTWQKVGLLKPTAAAVSAGNGSSVINDDGSVTITFTSAGNVIVSNCIAAAALTNITDVDILWSSGTAQSITMKQASGGVVDPVTTGYDTYGQSYTQAGAAAVASALSQTNWLISNGATGIAYEATIAIRNALDSSKPTRCDANATYVVTNGTAESKLILNLNNRASTVFGDLQFAVSGAGTLTLKFRPRV